MGGVSCRHPVSGASLGQGLTERLRESRCSVLQSRCAFLARAARTPAGAWAEAGKGWSWGHRQRG